MASPKSLYASDGNMNVDYVIHFKIPPAKRDEAEATYTQLIEELTKVGLATEVRYGSESSLLVFVKVASEQYLSSHIYRERVQDWLYGVRISAPEKNVEKAFQDEPVTDAERLRLVYLLITKPKNDGGAGVTPALGQWEYVASIFPLHNQSFNSQWIKKWSTKYLLDDDIDEIRDMFGEKVAFYFAFLQSYFKFGMFPAAFGFGAWLILGRYSWLFAAVNSLWTVVFFEWWKKKEVDLAVQWGVRGVSHIQLPRTQFEWDHEKEDPVTGEPVKVYSPMKRLRSQAMQIPFALICLLILGGLYVFCLAIEIFLSEVYNGPFKSYLTFTPTIILAAVLPALSTILTTVAEKLTEAENYETHGEHDASLVVKVFFINFITSYLPLFLSAFVYMPFGNILVPYLNFFKVAAERFSDGKVTTQGFQINPNRLVEQVIYHAVTDQIVNFAMEIIVPYVKRRAFKEVERMTQAQPEQKIDDADNEHEFLERVRHEVELDAYDVAVDYREMVVQFGYLSLFSCVWPLAPLSFFINNWVELRSDAMKIASGCKRPIPWRAESIGPWLYVLGFLSWLGSIIASAVIFLFGGESGGPRGEPSGISLLGLVLVIVCSEHLYLGLQYVVAYALKQMDSPGLQKERAQRFSLRKQTLQDSLGSGVTEKPVPPTVQSGEKITREGLEAEARRMTISGASHTLEQAFWFRQQGMDETVAMGRKLMSQMSSGSKETKS